MYPILPQKGRPVKSDGVDALREMPVFLGLQEPVLYLGLWESPRWDPYFGV
jgi:hypothetical protein